VNEFSSTLRELASLCGKSEQDLADLTGLDRAFIHRLMSGEKNPSNQTVIRLAIALPMDEEIVKKHPRKILNILPVLMMATLSDASAKSVQSRGS
jgi:transcriptional regulator with XRE-family HTH domain